MILVARIRRVDAHPSIVAAWTIADSETNGFAHYCFQNLNPIGRLSCMGTSRSSRRNGELAMWLVVSSIITASEEPCTSGLRKECRVFRCAAASIVPYLSTQRLPVRAKAGQGNTDHILV